MNNAIRSIAVMHRHFGFSWRPLSMVVFFHLRAAFNAVTCALDHLLFPRIHTVTLDRPVFILGNSRSGTTLMHRLLVELGPLCGFKLWEMMFPAVSARTLMRPLMDRLIPHLPPPPHSPEIHETGLDYAETDDAFLLLHRMDGPLFWAAVMAWEPSFPEAILAQANTPQVQTRLFDVLDATWRRNLVLHALPRLIVKSSAASGAIPEILKRYPDAKLLYMMRNPLHVIPSSLSLVEDVYVRMARKLREPTPSQLATYYENLYQSMCTLYRKFHEQHAQGLIPERNLKIVSYRRLMHTFDHELADVLSFIEVSSSRAEQLVRAQGARQGQRRSAHRYTLEQYGLSEARVRRDLDFIFQSYDVE